MCVCLYACVDVHVCMATAVREPAVTLYDIDCREQAAARAGMCVFAHVSVRARVCDFKTLTLPSSLHRWVNGRGGCLSRARARTHTHTLQVADLRRQVVSMDQDLWRARQVGANIGSAGAHCMG